MITSSGAALLSTPLPSMACSGDMSSGMTPPILVEHVSLPHTAATPDTTHAADQKATVRLSPTEFKRVVEDVYKIPVTGRVYTVLRRIDIDPTVPVQTTSLLNALKDDQPDIVSALYDFINGCYV